MRPRAVTTRSILLGFAIVTLGGCATTDTEDSGWNVGDAGHGDATRTDTVAMDAPQDAPRDGSTRLDAVDVPRDVPRDAPVDVPVDRGTTTPDTGAARCPSTCVSDSECMSMCPAAGAGYVNCCLSGTGGGTCYQSMGSVCPSSTPTDGGTTGTDSGFPLGGGPGSPCTMDSECSMGSTCCLMFSPGFGICGCNSGFGCLPPSGSSC